MFMQQTVAVPSAFDAALDRFEHRAVPALPALVESTRWAPDAAPGLGVGVADARDGVAIGPRRSTDEGCVYAIAWPARREIGRPEVDLDLELAPLDGDSTHIQFSARLGIPWVARWSPDERAAERRSTVAMTKLLTAIATILADGEAEIVSGSAPTR